MKDKIKSASKAHTIYKLKDGTRVPGTTTITGLLNKPFLIKWANDLGLEGIDSTKYRDEAAEAGTVAHEMISAHLQGMKIDTSIYSPLSVDLAENSFLSYLEWEKSHSIEPIIVESPFLHEIMKYGGTVDCYCKLDGIPTLLDFKTGKAIYDEYFVQVAGYREILIHHGYEVEQCRILRIGRAENEGFEDRKVSCINDYFEIFNALLHIYKMKKKVGWK